MIDVIGFMQGRLSQVVDGRIQAFPWHVWQHEFPSAKKIGLSTMEWTLDQEGLYQNPLMTTLGQREIVELCEEYEFSIPSLTGDCFMQSPFWKATDSTVYKELTDDFEAIITSCANINIKLVVVPLVDNGSIENSQQEKILIDFMLGQETTLRSLGIKVAFESDFPPAELHRFIRQLNSDVFGVNYDIGNSASLGFDPLEELKLVGDRVLNVHVKDRIRSGGSVPLGEGASDFNSVFNLLKKRNYNGNYILQTARATDGQHQEVLMQYRNFVQNWIV